MKSPNVCILNGSVRSCSMHRITSPDVTTALHGGNMLINSYYKSQELYFVCLCNICLQQGGSSWVFFHFPSRVLVWLCLFVCLPLLLELLLKFFGNSCICLLHSKSERCSHVINHIHSVNVFLRKFPLCCQLERKKKEWRVHRRLQWWRQHAWGSLEVGSLRVDCDDGGMKMRGRHCDVWNHTAHGKLNRFENSWFSSSLKIVFTVNMGCFVD